MQSKTILRENLTIDAKLAEFIDSKLVGPLGYEKDTFWWGVANIFERFSSKNKELLETRENLQAKIDAWHKEPENGQPSQDEYQAFLRDIGYLVPEPAPFKIGTQNVDAELAQLAGPQLVVPVLNARYALNAANARWGSLYDALYGSDAIAYEGNEKSGYDAARGEKVISWAKNFLDDAIPLENGKHADVEAYSIENGALVPGLLDPSVLVGFEGQPDAPSKIIFRHNGMHIELLINGDHPVGRQDKAGVCDVVLESALSTIVDFEDSVAAVDAEDKLAAYQNWYGLMQGDLVSTFKKGGDEVRRGLNEDRQYTDLSGKTVDFSGRSLMLVRNVGHLMTTPAVLLADGSEAPEGILDAIVTSLIGCVDLLKKNGIRNSKTGSIYIVKPKMHGPEECAFTNDLFNAVEDLLGLTRHTVKVGVMDEERRTSANLAACIHAVKDRIVFINTGFLDRTGDEMHTSMYAGPMIRKGEMKSSAWIDAYEKRNVAIGLACGFSGRAQIGKGMWAAPDRMSDMLEQKIGHPQTGANTAWVPSPSAATLHAVHYHTVDVASRQEDVLKQDIPALSTLLKYPVAKSADWSEEEISDELENNAQGLLGYVVRWIDQGVGCSKVPDINNISLMEDRATLRISSQHIANWLMHNVCTVSEVEKVLRRMAVKVDDQNADDPLYEPMAPSFDGVAYKAACALIFDGVGQPSGYTEPLLHRFRLDKKGLHQ